MFKNMNEIKAANRAIGHHFFDADAMRFFLSRIEDGGRVYGGRYFITSEQFEFRGELFERRYSLRRANDDGSIDTVFGQFQEWETLSEARKAAETAAASQLRPCA